MILRDSESYSNQIWIGIGVVGAITVLVGALRPSMRAARDPMGNDNVGYNYQMPRVESEDMPFDLSDRQVSRKMRELEALAKKKKEALKVADQKKAQEAAAQAAKKAAETKAQALAAAARRGMTVGVTDASDRYKMSGGLSANDTTSSPDYNQVTGGFARPAANTPANTKKETEDDTLELTSAQWRTLMLAEPSASTLAKFLKAHAAGKVEETTVIEVVRDLLKDSADDRHKAAMTLIPSLPSAMMFEFLVKEKVDFGQALQSELQVHQDSYSSPAKLMYLGPILAAVTEASVLSAAMEQITIAVQNYKKAQGGNVPQGTSAAPTLAQLQIFLATLKNVSANTDTSVAQVAQNLTQDIQGLRTTANVASTSLRRRNTVASENE